VLRWATPPPRRFLRPLLEMPRVPDRKLIEAQVTFGMFPGGALVTDVQEDIIQDAVANRVRLGLLDEGRRKPKGARPVKRVMQALAAKLRAKQEHGKTIWQRACDAIAANEVEGADFDLNSAQKDILCATYDKAGCTDAKLAVAIEIDGKSYSIKASTLYGYFMERVKS
jgi:hypothetical protein